MDINGSCRNSNHMLRWGLFVHSRLAQAVYETDGASSKHLPAGEFFFLFFFLKIVFMLTTKGQKCALHECGSYRGSFPEPILAQLSRTLCKPKSFYKASLRTFNCCGWNYKGLSECHVTWKLALLHNQLFVLFIRFYLKWTRTAHSNNSFQH